MQEFASHHELKHALVVMPGASFRKSISSVTSPKPWRSTVLARFVEFASAAVRKRRRPGANDSRLLGREGSQRNGEQFASRRGASITSSSLRQGTPG